MIARPLLPLLPAAAFREDLLQSDVEAGSVRRPVDYRAGFAGMDAGR